MFYRCTTWSRIIIRPGHRGGIGSCRIWIFLSDPTRFLSDSFRSESGPDFIGIRRNPMKSGSDLVEFYRAPLNSDEIRIEFWWNPDRIPMNFGSDSDWKESDKNRVGSDRFFMKDVGFRWNPTRIRSKTIGSTGRIAWPGINNLQFVFQINTLLLLLKSMV